MQRIWLGLPRARKALGVCRTRQLVEASKRATVHEDLEPFHSLILHRRLHNAQWKVPQAKKQCDDAHQAKEIAHGSKLQASSR